MILPDLGRMSDGSAIKVPLAELAQSKEKVRSALKREVMTASDTNFLLVWNQGA
jgi:hypothetical protein